MEPSEQPARDPSIPGATWRWALLLAGTCLLYLFQLGGLHNVKIGDETNYLQIARVTAGLPGWLPVSTDDGPWSTKPPLLFWQGILAARAFGETLFAYRLTSVFYSLATAALVARFLLKERAGTKTAIVGALCFLACFSTFRYGRAYLTNPPEVFWTFLAASLVAHWRPRKLGGVALEWTLLGLILGVLTLYRSFALVVPYCLFLALWLFHERRYALRPFLTRDVIKLVAVAALGLGIFSLWFLLDPNPQEVWDTFVRGENAGKVDEHGYLSGLFSGPHSLFGLWFGHLVNTALLAIPLLALVRMLWRTRHRLSRAEALCLTLILAYLLAFSIPSQRSGSYAMSGVPAIAVLLALRWAQFPAGVMRSACALFLIVLPVMLALALRVQLAGALGPGFPVALWPVLVGGIWLAWRAVRDGRVARAALLPLCFLLYLGLSLALRPMEGPLGRYASGAIAATRGQTLLMPSNHLRKHERYHFLLDPAVVHGYGIHGLDLSAESRAAIETALHAGKLVGVVLPEGADPAEQYPGCEIVGSRLDLRTRHSGEQLRAMILHGQLDLLLVREWLLRRRTTR